MHIIFAGGNYWKVPELPGEIIGDFKIVSGYRWIKSKQQFSNRWKIFSCPKGYQVLTENEAKVQGLI